MITYTFVQLEIDTQGMECKDRIWSIWCPEIAAWVKTWGKANLVFTTNSSKIDKNARRNTEIEVCTLANGNADKWRDQIDTDNYILETE